MTGGEQLARDKPADVPGRPGDEDDHLRETLSVWLNLARWRHAQ
jgi:hypothetical protein